MGSFFWNQIWNRVQNQVLIIAASQKVNDPATIKANEMAEVEFEPQQPLFVEPFDKCEGLARVAIMDGGSAVMLGKIVAASHS